jgi:thiamine pyrophosphate-dependent acetolactate synthase large subunit-like protein
MGYPSMFLSVPDASAFCFTQAYQSIGLGLASAIGAALAQPGPSPGRGAG